MDEGVTDEQDPEMGPPHAHGRPGDRGWGVRERRKTQTQLEADDTRWCGVRRGGSSTAPDPLPTTFYPHTCAKAGEGMGEPCTTWGTASRTHPHHFSSTSVLPPSAAPCKARCGLPARTFGSVLKAAPASILTPLGTAKRLFWSLLRVPVGSDCSCRHSHWRTRAEKSHRAQRKGFFWRSGFARAISRLAAVASARTAATETKNTERESKEPG